MKEDSFAGGDKQDRPMKGINTLGQALDTGVCASFATQGSGYFSLRSLHSLARGTIIQVLSSRSVWEWPCERTIWTVEWGKGDSDDSGQSS